VEQILASHPRVHGAGELSDVERLYTPPASAPSAVEYPESMNQLDAAAARGMADKYLDRLRQLGGDALRVVDKMPFNFLRLGFIAALFPRARIIHCRRDPVDVCMSCYFQDFSSGHPFALDLANLGLYYREYVRLMDHWKKVLPVPIFDLRYEELTAEQERVSRELLAYCGLEWDERCLRFHETPRMVRTASNLQVRQSLYRSSVGRWKRYEPYIQPLLAALGS
jgi:hypothetical protein